MQRQLLVVMLAMWAGSCRPAPEPAPDDNQTDFFEPERSFEEPTPDGNDSLGDAPDFSWWTAEDVVVHPTSDATDEELWLLWEHRHDPPDYQWYLRHPVIIAHAHPSTTDHMPTTESGSLDRDFRADMWISFGEPFRQDVRHVFQAPHYAPDRYVRAYETQDFVLVTHAGGKFYVIFDPQAARLRGEATLPARYSEFFEATEEYRSTVNLDVHLLFPSYQVAHTETLHLLRGSGESRVLREKLQ